MVVKQVSTEALSRFSTYPADFDRFSTLELGRVGAERVVVVGVSGVWRAVVKPVSNG